PSRQSTALIYVCGHRSGQHTPGCTPKIITSLAERAFRRPVAADEVAKYVALARRAEQDEGSFEEGLAVAIQALLVSPDFLFRLEHDRPAVPPATGRSIKKHELAPRLSSLLSGLIPDDS